MASIQPGRRVEVQGLESEDFKGAWNGATVVKVNDNVVTVRYDEFVTETGDKMLEDIESYRIRPTLEDDSARVSLSERNCGEAVDCWSRDCWWEGFVHETFDQMLTVSFPDSTEAPYNVYPLELQVKPNNDEDDAPYRIRTTKRWNEQNKKWKRVPLLNMPGATDHRSRVRTRNDHQQSNMSSSLRSPEKVQNGRESRLAKTPTRQVEASMSTAGGSYPLPGDRTALVSSPRDESNAVGTSRAPCGENIVRPKPQGTSMGAQRKSKDWDRGKSNSPAAKSSLQIGNGLPQVSPDQSKQAARKAEKEMLLREKDDRVASSGREGVSSKQVVGACRSAHRRVPAVFAGVKATQMPRGNQKLGSDSRAAHVQDQARASKLVKVDPKGLGKAALNETTKAACKDFDKAVLNDSTKPASRDVGRAAVSERSKEAPRIIGKPAAKEDTKVASKGNIKTTSRIHAQEQTAAPHKPKVTSNGVAVLSLSKSSKELSQQEVDKIREIISVQPINSKISVEILKEVLPHRCSEVILKYCKESRAELKKLIGSKAATPNETSAPKQSAPKQAPPKQTVPKQAVKADDKQKASERSVRISHKEAKEFPSRGNSLRSSAMTETPALHSPFKETGGRGVETVAELAPKKEAVTRIEGPRPTILGPAPKEDIFSHLLGDLGTKREESSKQLERSELALAERKSTESDSLLPQAAHDLPPPLDSDSPPPLPTKDDFTSNGDQKRRSLSEEAAAVEGSQSHMLLPSFLKLGLQPHQEQGEHFVFKATAAPSQPHFRPSEPPQQDLPPPPFLPPPPSREFSKPSSIMSSPIKGCAELPATMKHKRLPAISDSPLRAIKHFKVSSLAQDSDCAYLCIDNLGGGVTKRQLADALTAAGLAFKHVDVVTVNLGGEGVYSAGWGYAEFLDHNTATAALQRLRHWYMKTEQSLIPRPLIPHWPRRWPGHGQATTPTRGYIEGLLISSHFSQPNSIEFDFAVQWRMQTHRAAHLREEMRNDHTQQLTDIMLSAKRALQKVEGTSFANPGNHTESTANLGGDSKTLWLRKLPSQCTKEHLTAGFEQWGGQVQKILVDPITAAENGQALVTMVCNDQAKRIVNDISEMILEIAGSPRPVDATLARPGKPKGTQALYNNAMEAAFGSNDSRAQANIEFLLIEEPGNIREKAAWTLRAVMDCQAEERAFLAGQIAEEEERLHAAVCAQLDKEFRKIVDVVALCARCDKIFQPSTRPKSLLLPPRFHHLAPAASNIFRHEGLRCTDEAAAGSHAAAAGGGPERSAGPASAKPACTGSRKRVQKRGRGSSMPQPSMHPIKPMPMGPIGNQRGMRGGRRGGRGRREMRGAWR